VGLREDIERCGAHDQLVFPNSYIAVKEYT